MDKIKQLCGYEDVVNNARELLRQAKHSVCINADFPISEFAEELRFLADNNIYVLIFSFYDVGRVPAGVRVFTHGHRMSIDHVCNRLMIAVDDNLALTAGVMEEDRQWSGSCGEDKLMAAIVNEHVHNDIYLMQIRKKYGREIYDCLKINDRFERDRLEKGVY